MVEYGGVLVLVAAVVTAVLLLGLPAGIAGAVSCSAEKVVGLTRRCTAGASAGQTASQPTSATEMALTHPCVVPYRCPTPRRATPPKPAPPAAYGAWFYMGAPRMGGEFDMPCPPGYDFHRDLQTAQDYCAWRPYDLNPAQYDESWGDITDGRVEFVPKDVGGYQSNVADSEGTTELVDRGTPYAHYQYFPGGLAQYEDYQKVFQELSRAGDIASKPSKDREALEQQIEALAYGRSLRDAPGPGDTSDPSEWEDPTEGDG